MYIPYSYSTMPLNNFILAVLNEQREAIYCQSKLQPGIVGSNSPSYLAIRLLAKGLCKDAVH